MVFEGLRKLVGRLQSSKKLKKDGLVLTLQKPKKKKGISNQPQTL
jgi:hypothetical protein